MRYKAIIHFISGDTLVLPNLKLEGKNTIERMSSFIEGTGLQTANFVALNNEDTSLLISRDNITYVEIVEE